MFFDEHRDDHLIILMESWVGDRYLPSVQDYCDILLHKVNPIFDKLLHNQLPLADKIWHGQRYNEGKKLIRSSSDEDKLDYSKHYGIGGEDFEVAEMQTFFLAAGISGLFHLFERRNYTYLWMRVSASSRTGSNPGLLTALDQPR